MITVISLGAGVQSTTVALLAADGQIAPTPDCAIFADTGDEPGAVYRHLDWLMAPGRLPFPVHRIRAWDGYGNPSIKSTLGAEILQAASGNAKRGSESATSRGMHSRPPFFVSLLGGGRGMIRRQCTGDYKIDPIEAKVRELLGLRRRQRWPKEPAVEQWVGISTDEATRMKPSPRAAIRTRWPLIELGMSRRDCLAWLSAKGYPEPPKSACTFCPFHSDAQWRHLRDNDAAAWQSACELDDAIRHGLTSKGLTRGALYLHSSLRPLREVDLSTAEERGQLNMFENECAGVCGV